MHIFSSYIRVRVPNWKQPKYPLIGGIAKEIWYIHTMKSTQQHTVLNYWNIQQHEVKEARPLLPAKQREYTVI